MGRLVTLLSPNYSPFIHIIVSDLLKTIISLATPSPGAGITEGLQNGPASNLLVRELASKKRVETLVSYMLSEFSRETCKTPTALNREESESGENGLEHEIHDCALPSPTYDSSISSIVQAMGLLVELIRKNNSDYFEPYLFHTLRNRLIQVQQHSHLSGDDVREALESVMKDMVDRMGVVHLGPMLQILAERLGEFQKYLKVPRSLVCSCRLLFCSCCNIPPSQRGSINTTIGSMTPFTLERYRIVELYAELLHCSNMSLLNRPANCSQMYDSEGRLQGGLGGLEELAHVIALNGSYRSGGDEADDGMRTGIDESDEIEPALDFPIHGASGGDEMLGLDDDEGMMDSEDEPGSSDDEVMEEIVIYDEPPSDVQLSPLPVSGDGGLSPSSSESAMGVGNMAPSSTADATDLEPQAGQSTRKSSGPNLLRSSPDPTPRPGLISHPSSSSSIRRNAESSRRSSRSRRRAAMENSMESLMVVGEFMKRRMLDEGVVGMILVSNLFPFCFVL
jgi:serine/threonine-protein phosphatase 6 regulatory subunit 3